MTNEEKIKSMSTKELAQQIWEVVTCDTCPFFIVCKPEDKCTEKWEQWLKSEVD